MNLFVTDPHWGWWIIFYFFLGGIAAGAYFVSTLLDLVGHESERDLARLGYLLAFPLVSLCGVLLIVDLDRPERFWHMLVRSEVVHEALHAGWPWSGDGWQLLARAPLVKWWSPMSIGSWALLLFGLCSSLSLLGSWWREGRLARLLRWSILGRVLQVIGCGVGFFVAAYTGALLTATNQPLWSDTSWIAPLFLASSASTGLAALILLAHGRQPAESVHRLERADLWALLLELVVLAVFVGSLGTLLPVVLRSVNGMLLAVGTLLVGILLPLALHLRRVGRAGALAAATLVLLGGFVLRYALLSTPPELLARKNDRLSPSSGEMMGTDRLPWLPHFSPEDQRAVGQPGADAGNRPTELEPRSKVFSDK